MHLISDQPTSPAIHLNPQAELAERVLLPGDPQRALAVAQTLLDTPRMFNVRRGLWGYTGDAADGAPVTIQSTGMGGPSAAIVIEELIALGARSLIRIGTCGALDPTLKLGQLVALRAAIATDGTSRALGAGATALPDESLTRALVDAGARAVTGVSSDLFYDAGSDGLLTTGAQVVEMEAATLFTLAARRGVVAACLLGVSDRVSGERARIGQEALEELGIRLGRGGLAALLSS